MSSEIFHMNVWCTAVIIDSFSVDCKWGDFGEWGGCTQTCGEGIQTRTRKRIQVARFGGILCAGYSTESKACNVQDCPGKVSIINWPY